ncbi:MAG: glycosyltransferase family 4 protein [Chloroflexi bacterium]|nr:glycosyltransferase family 4 protein [Chloroflexota bacterium]
MNNEHRRYQINYVRYPLILYNVNHSPTTERRVGVNNTYRNIKKLRIGFISTRFAGTDGVSLETAKWAEVLEEMGHTCYYFAGICDRPASHSMVVPKAFYHHPEIEEHHQQFWGETRRTEMDSKWIHQMREYFKEKIYTFKNEFQIDLLIPENVLSIPLNIPLGLAIAEFIAETNLPTIAHHHDFTWERKRFIVNSVWDYITMAFPPTIWSIQHVVINSSARHQLARRTGVGSTIIPNVMDYERKPPAVDAYSADLRQALGLDPDELFILQPTRVVQRKGIEHSIELVSRLNRKARLVISHASGDEGQEYEQRVRHYAKMMGVNALFISDLFDEKRRIKPNGEKIYSLWDAYPQADLITYPSLIEGFGNAFLEAIYFKRPIVVNNYTIFAIDIRTKGFNVIEFDNYITQDTVQKTIEVLDNPQRCMQMCEENYRLACQHYSYSVLRTRLSNLISHFFGFGGGNGNQC